MSGKHQPTTTQRAEAQADPAISLAELVARVVDQAPPLTPAQCASIAALLRRQTR